MKKLLLATLLSLSSAMTLANAVDPFAEVKTLLQSNDRTGAFKALEKVAKTNHPDALYNLGYLTEIGQGTAQNNKKAVQYYEKAAKQGSSIANFVLAKSYETGRLGLKANAKKAQTYLEAADRLGSAEAKIEIAEQLFAKHNAQSNQEALNKLAPLVKQGHVGAGYAQATFYINDGFRQKNVPQVQQGLNELHALGQKGHVASLLLLGNLYATGSLVKQDLPKAKTIFTALDQAKVPEAKPALTIINKALAAQAEQKMPEPKKVTSKTTNKKA